MSHKCPCAACTTFISDEKLMCASHWKLVPTFLQRDVNNYWRKRSSGDNRARLLAIHNYRVARDAAIKHVDELLAPLATA